MSEHLGFGEAVIQFVQGHVVDILLGIGMTALGVLCQRVADRVAAGNR